MDNDYYVYIHKKLNTDDIFYVGLGKGRRAYNKNARSRWWKNIVNKYGLTIEITSENISFKEAAEIEKYLIKYYGRLDLGTGCLVNLTDGGEGSNGRVYFVTEKTREKMRNSGGSRKGFKLSEEHKLKLGISKGFKIINKDTNIIYHSISEASRVLNLSFYGLSRSLRGFNTRETYNFEYVI